MTVNASTKTLPPRTRNARHADDAWPYRWTSAEYHRIAEAGLFEGKRVELIEGTVMQMPPMSRLHWLAEQLTANALRRAFGPEHFVVSDLPLYLDDLSEPEPDVAVLEGDPRDYASDRPTLPVLVVEVADSSLRRDRAEKASLYARHGIREYWILNLKERKLEVYREPREDAAQPYGYGYTAVELFGPQERVTPLASPETAIPVSALLP